MDPLVTYAEQATFLELPMGTDKELLEDLLVQTQALFENLTGRTNSPFGAAQTGRVEIHEGFAWSNVLRLDYPIASITSIVAGRDVAFPDEVITPGDTSSVVWVAGERDLRRVDGGYWRRWSPTWVKVVYNTADDRPEDVKLAIKRKVATVYQGRGKEGFSSITRGSRSWTMQDAGTGDPIWESAVSAHRRGWFR